MQLTSRILPLLIMMLIVHYGQSQTAALPGHLSKTNIARLQSGDSLIYYQCHVDEASQELTTISGQKISTKPKKLTITEKFVVYNRNGEYSARYSVSGFNDFPNKKFAYLTLTEVANWGFEFKRSGTLSQQDVLVLALFENKTHDIVDYELKINKSCTNEVVIVHKKDRTQLIVEGDYLLSKNLSVLKN
jgi:hypothetical protein